MVAENTWNLGCSRPALKKSSVQFTGDFQDCNAGLIQGLFYLIPAEELVPWSPGSAGLLV